jgi:hypothetical protein
MNSKQCKVWLRKNKKKINLSYVLVNVNRMHNVLNRDFEFCNDETNIITEFKKSLQK